mmetsp:Transcript_16612/g.33784  ORF Transcript_16612/g.33784 Transcript_16612/m.33784 type:complete len:130 (+) Transcript_16612:282-671(+)
MLGCPNLLQGLFPLPHAPHLSLLAASVTTCTQEPQEYTKGARAICLSWGLQRFQKAQLTLRFPSQAMRRTANFSKSNSTTRRSQNALLSKKESRLTAALERSVRLALARLGPLIRSQSDVMNMQGPPHA